MATLLETLYWTTDPTIIYGLISGNGFIDSSITAAESQDANNATRAAWHTNGNGFDIGTDEITLISPVTTATTLGTITSVKLIFYGLTTGAGACNANGYINGSVYGSTAISPSVPTNVIEFLTDPVLTGAWTLAGINAKQFGWYISEESVDEFSTQSTYMSEFRVEVWGDAPAPPPSTGVKVFGIPHGKRWWGS
jgi:hypothetical protein